MSDSNIELVEGEYSQIALSAMDLGFADATFGSVVWTHGDDKAFFWESQDGKFQNRISETGRVFHEEERIWLSRWRYDRVAKASGQCVSVLMDSPDTTLRDEYGQPAPFEHVSIFTDSLIELMGISKYLNATVPTLLSPDIATKDGVKVEPSYSYYLANQEDRE